MENQATDILVIGSGIAGLSFALKMAQRHPHREIAILAKTTLTRSNTHLAQGGIAAATEGNADDPENHYQDTLQASHFTADPAVAHKITHQAPQIIRDLIHWGVSFDQDANGQFNKAREGAHTYSRVLHNQDQTGAELISKLLGKAQEQPNIRFFPFHMALDLLTENHTCHGAMVWDKTGNILKRFPAQITYLASGGSGQVFRHSTNASVATGDATGLAQRAGLALQKMAYYQFHPTALYEPGLSATFLISEAIRGAGAILRNENGEAFMGNYHPQGDLASRNVVTQAEFDQLNESRNGCLYLDGTTIPEITWKTNFPTIYKKCTEQSLDPVEDWIPVLPAAHYQCGGIPVDESGQTELDGLYAGGECAYSGFHGNNRLASNSLLEGIALADWSARAIKINGLESYPHKPDHLPATTFQKPSKWWVNTQKNKIQKQMQTLTSASTPSQKPNSLLNYWDRLLKTWHAWQTEGYLLDKDFQELGNMAYTAKAITKDKLDTSKMKVKAMLTE